MGKRVVTEQRKQYQLERRNRLRAEGICVSCLKRPATLGPSGGTKCCDHCRELIRTAPSQAAAVARRAELQRIRCENAKCAICGEPISLGPQGGKSRCGPCRDKLYAVRSGRKQRVTAINIYGGECMDCGFNDHRVLEFHHVNFNGSNDREKNRSTGLNRRIAKAGTRLSDIVMVCANCHSIRHWNHRWRPELILLSPDPSSGASPS